MAGHAEQYLTALAWGQPVTWQTVDDSGRGRRELTRVMHGTLGALGGELAALNSRGAGIFVAVNETDLRGRRAGNVTRIRALFTDDDGGGSDEWPVPPCFFVRSARGVHAYWLLKAGERREDFGSAQRALAAMLGTDPAIHDLPRVMRCPGFAHRKCRPIGVTFEPGEIARRYSIRDVVGDLPKPKPRNLLNRLHPADRKSGKWWNSLNRTISSGGRNRELFRLACRLRADRLGVDEIEAAISELNDRLCDEPLGAREIAQIARSAGKYPC